DVGQYPPMLHRQRQYARLAGFDLHYRHFVHYRAAEIGLREGRPDLGQIIDARRVQRQVKTFVFLRERRVEDRIADSAGRRLGYDQTVDTVAEIVQHTHGIAEQTL